MNPFVHIIDSAGLMIAGSGGSAPRQLSGLEVENPELDFGRVLNNKLTEDVISFIDPGLLALNPELNIAGKNGKPDETVLKPGEFIPSGLGNCQFNAETNQQHSQIQTNSISVLPLMNNLSADDNELSETPVSDLEMKSGRIVDPEVIADGKKLLPADLRLAAKPLPALQRDGVDIRTQAVGIESGRQTMPATEIDDRLSARYEANPNVDRLMMKVAENLDVKDIEIKRPLTSTISEKSQGKLDIPLKPLPITPSFETKSDRNTESGQRAWKDTGASPEQAEPNSLDKIIKENGQPVRNNIEPILSAKTDLKQAAVLESVKAASADNFKSDIGPAGINNNIGTLEPPASKTEMTPIKFILPTDFSGKSLKNNHTVMIRMEPEHLGPVRMTISSLNDSLTARLVVESAVAKAAIESNLSNLVDQLDRQGIKVDIFEVSVSGGQVGKEFTEKKFTGRLNKSIRGHNNYDGIKAMDDARAERIREQLYIGPNGVNCFA